MNFDNFNNSQRNSSTLTLEDNDLLDDEWLYTSEPFDRTNTFRRKVKTEGESRNSVLEWLATDDDKIDIKDDCSINLEDIHKNNLRNSKNLFDDNFDMFNSDSLFDDDLDITTLDSKFMNNFKLVSQDDYEDTEIEEAINKNKNNTEMHRCDSPNTEIDLIETNKLGSAETVNIEDNDSDSNMTIINTTYKNKNENVYEDDKKTEIINIDNENKSNEVQNIELNKLNLIKKSEIAQKRFLAKVEEAKKTLENLKPRKDSLTSSEKDLNVKTLKFEEEKEEKSEEKKDEKQNKKKLERRSYYYYADTGSDDEKEENIKTTNNPNEGYSTSFKKTFNYFNSGGADSSVFNDDILYSSIENNITSPSLLSPYESSPNRFNEDFEDYPRKPPAPAVAPTNSSLLNNLMDHANFESQQNYQSDVDTESNSSLHSDLQLPEFYNNHFANYNPSKSSLGYHSSSPSLKPTNLYIPSSPSLKSSNSFIPTSPSIKSTTSFIPTSPSLKSNASLIPSSPSIKPKKINTSFIPTSPSLKSSNSHIPTSPSVGKYTSSTASSLYNKQKSHITSPHITSPRVGYTSPSSPSPYSKSYETRVYDPVAPTYSIKDLISNKNPSMLGHSNSITSTSSISSSSTYKPSSQGYSRKSSLEQNPQLKSYLNKMASSQRSKSPSMLSTTSTNSSKYSSGRKTPNSRLGTHYAESTTSSASSSSKIYTKYKSPSSSTSTISKIGTGSSTYLNTDYKSKLSSSYSKSLNSHSNGIDFPSDSKLMYSNNNYNGRLSKTPTPSNYSKSSRESRIPSPSPYSKRSITPSY